MKLWGQLWTTLHSFCTHNLILFKYYFLSIRVFSWPDFKIYHVEYILACYILISEKEIVSVTRQVENMKFMYKTLWRVLLFTTCHHFEYRPLVIAKFQRAVTSLFFA